MAASRSSRAYSNLQVESIRWQKSAIPPGSTGSFLILDEDGVVTFGQDAILNSLSLQNLYVSQGTTTGTLTVLAGTTIGGDLKVVGSMTAQNVTAMNALTAVNGVVTNLQVTGTLIVDGDTLVPSGTSVIEAQYIFAGATGVPLSGFQGYNLDVSGSAIFRGGLTLGGSLVATNSVIARGADAQVVFEAPAGGVVGTIQGLASGMFIESDQAIKFSNLNETAGDILTINPVGPTVTIGSGVTLNVQGIGGLGLTVTPPAVFTGAVTINGPLNANGMVTAGATVQVTGVIDARGGISNTLPGGVLNLNDSVAVAGTLNTQGVIQQGSALGAGGLPLQLQPTSGQVSIGNAGNTVTVVGPLVVAGLTGSTANFSGLVTGYGGLTTTTGFFSSGVTVAGGLTGSAANFSGLVTGYGGLTTTTGFFSSGVTVVGGLTGSTANFSGLVTGYGGLTTTTGFFSSGVTSATYVSAAGMNVSINNTDMPTSGLFIGSGIPASVGSPYTLPNSNGAALTWNAVRLIENGTTTEDGNLEVVVGAGTGSGNFRMYNTIGTGATAYQNTLTLTRNGSLSVLGDLAIGGSATIPVNLTVPGLSVHTIQTTDNTDNTLYITGPLGGTMYVAPAAAHTSDWVLPLTQIGDAVISYESNYLTVGTHNGTGGMRLDSSGNLLVTGGLTASAGNFGSGTVQTTGAVNTGTLVATGGIDARGGISNSTGTLNLNDNVSVSGNISANFIQNNYSTTILGPSYAWQYYWTGSFSDAQSVTAISGWADNYSSPQSYGLYTPPFGSYTTGYQVPVNGIYVLTLFVRTSDNAGTVGFRFCYADTTPIPSNGDGTLWIPRDAYNRQSASYTIVTKLSTSGGSGVSTGIVTVSLEGGGGGSGDIDACWFSGYLVAQL